VVATEPEFNPVGFVDILDGAAEGLAVLDVVVNAFVTVFVTGVFFVKDVLITTALKQN
jgi:hypothetical protein